MFDATREKTRLWLLILVGIVATLLGQTHAREIFAPSPPESGIFAAQTPASTEENYDACRYDALDSLLAANTGGRAGTTALSTYRSTTAGESFVHYGYAENAAGFAGGLRPGGYATTASGLSGAEARAGLALPHATPPNAVYQVTPSAGTSIRVNPITSPQFGQPGGLPEFQFPLGTGAGTVSGPTRIPR